MVYLFLFIYDILSDDNSQGGQTNKKRGLLQSQINASGSTARKIKKKKTD